MKTILITGTSSGIGKATAKKFAAEGWNVIATMRSPEKEEELSAIKNIFLTKLDVQNKESIAAAISAGIEKFGSIDAIVNNAGFGVLGAFEKSTTEQILQQFSVNVFGVMDVIKAILPHFRARQAGLIINITSQGGRVTFPTCSLYHSTKFAIEGFSESLAYELLSQNISVKIIEPGSTESNFFSAVSMSANDSITAYEEFDKIALENWAKNDTMSSTTADIAQVIYEAACDNKDQLRYMAGVDTHLYFGARQNKSDQDYVNYMRKLFIPEILNKESK
ncbi:SDR family oxidoreductase [Pedobacter cryoconitis]|uniref:NADP-dependent 3-hydroxy acid dehydrogenase YdfG n=1 Tax=Pedobacter cryoconitis TaxID=188932 RepID=A0A327SS99_9SPHI|nr:SDR family oxidoreductase [Pedobacter cryoconitis]RAJ32170.1 NADP-dependent 3-hydroxy acid dehydrogenase YdfG [Pedobacter cryoconitis]